MPDGSLLPVPYRPNGAPAVRVLAWPHPLRVERIEAILPAGDTIAGLLDTCEFPEWARPSAQVWIADAAMRAEPLWVPPQLWRLVRPKAGTVVTVRVVPGKKGAKGFLGILLSIVTAAVGFLVPGIGGALIGFGLKLLGSVLIPKPKPPKSSQSGGGVASSPTYSVSGSRNQASPYGPVPRLYGRHRVTPPLGALPFTEIVGDDQFLRMVFCFGYGPLQLEDLRIGETPLASYDDVEYEVRQGYDSDAALTLYTQDVFENPLSVELTFAGGAAVQVSQPGADELSIDVTFDRGLGAYFQNGVMGLPLTVSFSVEYRIFGSGGAWTNAGNLDCTAAIANLARRGKRWTVSPRGQYEVRVTRLTAELVLTNVVDHSIWTTLRTITATAPITQTGMALVAVRIRASDQLNGVIDQFNAIATAMLPTWSAGSPGGWTVPVATRNPAWAYLDALRGNANKRPLADARLDLPAFAAWAADCDALAQDGEASFTFDAVFDFAGTLFDALRAIAAAGRASFAMVDGKFSIVQDQPQTVPIQHFTPRNSFGFKGTKAFADPVHALKVQFVNEDAGWQKDEATVYADGYTEANATLFEALETFGITRYGQAWREGRYHQAVAILRPESYQISCDIEHIVCKRGDLIRVSHDAPLWGGGWGRIKSRTQNAASPSSVTALTLDETLTMEAGHTYVLRVRRADGTSDLRALTTVAGDSATLQLATPVATASAPAVGDLAMFGETNLESIEGIVLSILPEADFGARITFADAAPNIHLAYTGTIPAFQSSISQAAPHAQRLPARPVVESARSDETVLLLMPDGSLLTRILVLLGAQSVALVPTAAIEVQFRRADGNGTWQRMALQPAGAGVSEVSVMPVADGAIYDVRLRALSAFGTASDWAEILDHTVIGKTTPPPDVANLRREGDWLRWSYLDRPRDFAGFFVRHRPGASAEWDDSLDLFDGILGPSEINIAALVGGGTRTVMVKAVDVAGNVSATPAAAVLELGDPIVDNVVTLYDWSGDGFPGEIVNGSVVGGELVADDGTVFWSGNDGAAFWSGTSVTPFWTTPIVYPEMMFTAGFTPAVDEVGARLTLIADVAAGVWELLYRTFGEAIFWASYTARTNYALWSEKLDNAAWTKTRLSVSADAAIGSDGAQTFDQLIEDTTVTSTHEIVQDIAGLAPSQLLYASCDAKANGRWLRLYLRDPAATGNEIRANFNLTTGEVQSFDTAGNGIIVDASIVSLGGDIYRCSIQGTPNTSGTNTRVIARLLKPDLSFTYTGDGVSGIYLGRIDVGTAPGAYVATTSAAAAGAVEVSPFWSGDDGALFWTPSVDDFVPWPGELELTAQRYEVRVRTGAGLIQGVVTTIQGVVDVPDEEETLDDVVIAAGGTRLPILESYRSIRSVLLTLQDDGGNAASAIVLDKSETLGPLVQCFDIAGAATSGQVDAQIQGVAA